MDETFGDEFYANSNFVAVMQTARTVNDADAPYVQQEVAEIEFEGDDLPTVMVDDNTVTVMAPNGRVMRYIQRNREANFDEGLERALNRLSRARIRPAVNAANRKMWFDRMDPTFNPNPAAYAGALAVLGAPKEQRADLIATIVGLFNGNTPNEPAIPMSSIDIVRYLIFMESIKE